MPVGAPIYTDYEPDAIANQAAPPIGMPEGNFAGKHVNDIQRHMAAVIRRLGDACLLLAGSVFSAENKRISDVAIGTLPTDVVTLKQLQKNGGIWGGTSGGSTNIQTLTPSPEVAAYEAGQQFRMIAGFTNTGAMTMNVSGLGALSVRDPYGNLLAGGELRATRRHTLEHDGTRLRLLDPVDWMDQSTYNTLFPIRSLKLHENQTAPPVPNGVTATWTRVPTNAYLRGTSGAPTFGGSLITEPEGGHTHTMGQANETQGASAGAGSGYATAGHEHTVNPAGSHTHAFEPPFHSVSVWERTA